MSRRDDWDHAKRIKAQNKANYRELCLREPTTKNVGACNGLLRLYQIGVLGAGFQSLAIQYLQTTGLWGMCKDSSGEYYPSWERFCLGHLGIGKSTASRMAGEGGVARKLLGTLLEEWMGVESKDSSDTRPIVDRLASVLEKIHASFSDNESPLFSGIRFLSVIQNRKTLSTMKRLLPAAQWVEAAEYAMTDAKPDAASIKTYAAKKAVVAVAERRLAVAEPPVGDGASPTDPARFDSVREALDQIGRCLCTLSKDEDGPLVLAAPMIFGFSQQLRLLAKKLEAA